MFKEEALDKIEAKRREWEEVTLKRQLDRFGVKESPNKFYTPLDIRGFDFLQKVGFPGQYSFTAGTYPINPFKAGLRGTGSIGQFPGMSRAGRYSG